MRANPHTVAFKILWLLAANFGFGGEVAQYGDSYGDWATTWQVLPRRIEVDNAAAEAFDFDGDLTNPGLYWANSNEYTFTEDIGDGASSGDNISTVWSSPIPVPEPSSTLMIALAGFLGVFRRRTPLANTSRVQHPSLAKTKMPTSTRLTVVGNQVVSQ